MMRDIDALLPTTKREGQVPGRAVQVFTRGRLSGRAGADVRQFWVEVSVTDSRTQEAKCEQRGPFDSFTQARISAEAVNPYFCTVENATIACEGTEVVGYKSKLSWRWDAVPAGWLE